VEGRLGQVDDAGIGARGGPCGRDGDHRHAGRGGHRRAEQRGDQRERARRDTGAECGGHARSFEALPGPRSTDPSAQFVRAGSADLGPIADPDPGLDHDLLGDGRRRRSI
ncbi:hypothetical protein RZS08_04150, partial [Arthrospira platensis SPKY1]|nr:hypothetical protein [Arthrospira platensis SPKY1]